MQSYELTGNQIPVKSDELINYVLNKFLVYNQYVNDTGQEPDFNPYLNPIVYTTKDGKTIEIPKVIVQEAINIQKKDIELRKLELEGKFNPETDFDLVDETPTAPTRQTTDEQTSPVDNNNNKNNNNNNNNNNKSNKTLYIVIGVLLLLLLVGGILYYRSRNRKIEIY